jgi:cellulose synthase/poly-beta-1,6-N-acetylglucosamine synthase-like glycosyltransferase
MGWQTLVLALYLAVLGALSLNGLHRAWLVWAWSRSKAVGSPPAQAEWPFVTVQLPIFNERYVVERLVDACAALDYPRDRLEIQVLDDSTDDTTALAEAAAARARASGVDARVIRRGDRRGFKAGALQAGLTAARGTAIAVFDADFVPPPNFLRLTVPWLAASPRTGMVQTRWGHLNAGQSWLTRAQATLLDGHFVIEHTARHRMGRWFNFNGTAGVWRRAAIEEAGGWEHDTLTEDLDLSYRAQLAGWRFVYLDQVVTPAELPGDMRAFKGQQHRWAKGSVQTCRKLLARIWRSDAPLPVKMEATVHLGANFTYPLVILLSLLLPWAVAARISAGPVALLELDSALFGAAILPFIVFYAVAISGSGEGGVGRRLRQLPMVLGLGVGMAVSQTRAVFEGVVGSTGTFIRTPKTGEGSAPSGRAARVPAAGYRLGSSGIAGIELLLAAYLGAAAVYAGWNGYAASIPFLALFTFGYGAVGVGTLRG